MGKILITGGAGYIGSHISYLLEENGYECIVYDNLSRGNKVSVKKSPLIIGDIRDRKKLADLFKAHQFDAVVHLAALAYVGESVLNPIMYWDNNFIGTKTLLEEMIRAGIIRIIFSSTCFILFPIHLITGTAIELPIAFNLADSGHCSAFFPLNGI